MTWITLHLKDGSPVDINMALIVGIAPQEDGTTKLWEPQSAQENYWRVTETREQIQALRLEAESRAEYVRAAIRRELGL